MPWLRIINAITDFGVIPESCLLVEIYYSIVYNLVYKAYLTDNVLHTSLSKC